MSTKKRLNPDTIANELRGNSAYFPGGEPQPVPGAQLEPMPVAHGPATAGRSDAAPAQPPISPPISASIERKNERSDPRRKIRHTFDIYADQLLSLRQIALEREQRYGDRVLLGDLVQEALDTLILSERTSERSDDRTTERTPDRTIGRSIGRSKEEQIV